MEDKDNIKRRNKLRESLQNALKIIGPNPVLLEPRYLAMVVAVYAGEDSILSSEFNKFLSEAGSLNYYDRKGLDKLFWDWLKNSHSNQFIHKKSGEPSSSGGISLQRLSSALKEELEEKYERESEQKMQHAKDKVRQEVSKEFSSKIEEIVKNTGQTSKSLNSMDEIIEKGGKSALNLLSNHIESAIGSANLIGSNAGDLESKVRKLEEEIQYDTIPGLFTVRIFTKRFQEFVEQFKEKNIPFTVAFIAIDNIDKFSSAADPMLSRKIFLGISQQIIGELHDHPADIVPARYDANLMGILFPQMQIDDAITISDKIRNMVKEHVFTAKDGKTLDFTLSVGIAKYTTHDDFGFDDIPGGGKQLTSTIFTRAMEALKKAQEGGGNRVKKEESINSI